VVGNVELRFRCCVRLASSPDVGPPPGGSRAFADAGVAWNRRITGPFSAGCGRGLRGASRCEITWRASRWRVDFSRRSTTRQGLAVPIQPVAGLPQISVTVFRTRSAIFLKVARHDRAAEASASTFHFGSHARRVLYEQPLARRRLPDAARS